MPATPKAGARRASGSASSKSDKAQSLIACVALSDQPGARRGEIIDLSADALKSAQTSGSARRATTEDLAIAGR